jgi:hypothetical protein
MKCDFWASFLACTSASLYFGHEPIGAKVVTMMYLQNHCNNITNGRCIKNLLYVIETLVKIS